jgi:hypothetical protein
MITWHARVYNLRNTAPPPHTAQNWVSPERAGALAALEANFTESVSPVSQNEDQMVA